MSAPAAGTMNPLHVPADVRVLAALCHVGVYACGVVLLALRAAARVVGGRSLPDFSGGYTGPAIALVLAGALFVPALAALRAARGSPWREMLRTHAVNALLVHLGTLAWFVVAVPIAMVSGALAIVATLGVLMHWIVVPMLSAQAAMGGYPARYPWDRRVPASVP